MTALTEPEAKTKWCPFVRLRGRYDDAATSSFNRCPPFPNDMAPECHCIASECMAWRWQPSSTVQNPSRVPGHGQYIKREAGYCGLAGGPT